MVMPDDSGAGLILVRTNIAFWVSMCYLEPTTYARVSKGVSFVALDRQQPDSTPSKFHRLTAQRIRSSDRMMIM